MNVQNYLLCILYVFLVIIHSFTLCEKDFHRSLISIFSFALITETLSTLLFAAHQIVLAYGQQLTEFADVDLSPIFNIHYFAQLIHIISINFFILFLLIVAKGWPITRQGILFKYAFAIFWILCLAADLITFYWTTLTIIAKNLANEYNTSSILANISNNSTTSVAQNDSIIAASIGDGGTATTAANNSILFTNEITSNLTSTKLTTSIIESLPNDTEQFNTTPRRLSLVLRIVIMLYFLLELRTTMILEQEKKKLQFYLQFGALSMVWFVHSIIVYVISLRVEIVWQSKLISGFSSAANFLAFAVATRLLWPQSSRSYLFRKQKRDRSESADGVELDNLSTINSVES